jgi:hypothetical protein
MAELLQIEIASAVEIAAAETAIRMATAAIQNYCGQVLALVEDEQITLDSAGGPRLFLPELPVVSVAQVVEDGEILVVDDDYKLGQYGILYRVDADWAAGIQIVTVTYTHGQDPIPDDAIDICTRAALRRYQAGLRAAEMDGVPGVASKSLGDYAVSYGSEQSTGAGEAVLGASAAPILLRSEKEVLSRYRYRGV